MKKGLILFAVLVMILGLCVGCEKADTSKQDATKPTMTHSNDDGQDHSGHNHGAVNNLKPEPTKLPMENNTQKWQPETAEQPSTHNNDDGHDHSGHDH